MEIGQTNISADHKAVTDVPHLPMGLHVEVWHQVLNGKWILGFSLLNMSNQTVSDVDLKLKCMQKSTLAYSTMKLKLKDSLQEASELSLFWETVDKLPGGISGNIIAVIEVNQFAQCSSVTVCGAITFSTYDGKANHIKIENTELDLFNIPYSSQFSLNHNIPKYDVFSVILVNERFVLDAKFLGSYMYNCKSLQTIFVEELYFTTFLSNVFLHKGDEFCELAGILIHINAITNIHWILHVFVKDFIQLNFLIDAIYCTCSIILVSAPEKYNHGNLIGLADNLIYRNS